MSNDSTEVIKLNQQAYNDRLTDPSGTVKEANKALNLANKLNFKAGIAEANRVLGVGYFYLNQPEKAISNYLTALKYFENNRLYLIFVCRKILSISTKG